VSKGLICTALLLAACTQAVPPNDELSDSPEMDFQRKIECSKYINEAEKKTEEFGKELAGDDAMHWPNMERVFYSPKVNSCVFVWSNNLVEADGYNRVDRGLNDILTGEELLRGIYIEGDSRLVTFLVDE